MDKLFPFELEDNLPPVWEALDGLHQKTAFIRGVESLPIHTNDYLCFSSASMPGIHAFGSILNGSIPLPTVQ